MFATPRPLLEIRQLFSCARLGSEERPPRPGEIMVTVRGRRRQENGRDAELFEETYFVDFVRLSSLRATLK